MTDFHYMITPNCPRCLTRCYRSQGCYYCDDCGMRVEGRAGRKAPAHQSYLGALPNQPTRLASDRERDTPGFCGCHLCPNPGNGESFHKSIESSLPGASLTDSSQNRALQKASPTGLAQSFKKRETSRSGDVLCKVRKQSFRG
jgi:hypothetical protein